MRENRVPKSSVREQQMGREVQAAAGAEMLDQCRCREVTGICMCTGGRRDIPGGGDSYRERI